MTLGTTTAVTHVIEHGKFKIVIMESPSDANSPAYIERLRSLGVTDVVRTCEPTYDAARFEKEGIRVHEMSIPDGAPPPDDTIAKWLDLLRLRYRSKDPSECGMIAVHCVAGLGRAPVMAAVALLEMTTLDPLDVVEKIRAKQKGAINARQLKFLQSYKRITKSGVMPDGARPCGCVMM
mmetsp:Transcript_7863/g.22606  ORF Transcript_7863/g.22606 Transcript_7863/m.22606 type:complete len:179 (-) Transcript_7863:206-742(-)